MKFILPFIALSLTITSCDHNFSHERIVKNNTLDTLNVINPDFKDVTHIILPGEEKVIYEFENLDSKQEKEPCMWLGDTLIIKSIHDSICIKATTIESNWTSVVGGTDKARKQTCTFMVDSTDFEFGL